MDLVYNGRNQRPRRLQDRENSQIPCIPGMASHLNSRASANNLISVNLPHSISNYAEHSYINNRSENQYDNELGLRTFQDGSIGYIPPTIGVHNAFNSEKAVDRKAYTYNDRPRDGILNEGESSKTGSHFWRNQPYYASESNRGYTNISTNAFLGTLSSGRMGPSADIQTSFRPESNSGLHELSAMNLPSFELPADSPPHEGYVPATSTEFPTVQRNPNSTSNRPIETFRTGHTPEHHSESIADSFNVQQEQDTDSTRLFVSGSDSIPAVDNVLGTTTRIDIPQSASFNSDEQIVHNVDVYSGFTSRNTLIPSQNPSQTGYHHGPIPDPNPGWQIPEPAEFGRREGRNTVKWLKRPESQPPNPRVKLSNLNTLICDVVVHTWPEGVVLCGRTYDSNGDLRAHMRACHASAVEPELARKQPTASERAAGQIAIQEWVLTRKWRNTNYAFEPMNPAKSLCSHYAELFEARARRDVTFAREFGRNFRRQYNPEISSNKPQFTASYIWEATVDRRGSGGATGTNSFFAVNSGIPNMNAFPRGTFDQSSDDERAVDDGDDRDNNDNSDAVDTGRGDDEREGARCERIVKETAQSMNAIAITEANKERARRREAALKEDQRIRRILEAETINERNNDCSEPKVALTQSLGNQPSDTEHRTATENRCCVPDASSFANGEVGLDENEARVIGDLFDDNMNDDDDEDNDDNDINNDVNNNDDGDGDGANDDNNNANDGDNKGNENDNDKDKNDNEDDTPSCRT